MERKVSRRGPRLDHPPLDKTMIGMPTNFSHVGHSYPPRDRYGECVVTEVPGATQQDCPEEARQERGQGRETEGNGPRTEGDHGEEYEASPLPPLSPDSSRRNSRKISKDMISLPTNFRHVLHIDPTSADPAHLSLLLKTSTDLEYDLQYEEEDDHDDPASDPQEPTKDPSETAKATKPHRPSGRVRKNMISLPTNFQHVSHISAGERLDAPESPPPDVPPEPGQGDEVEERRQKTNWGYNKQTTTSSTAPYTTSTTPYTDSTTPYTTPATPYTESTAPYPTTYNPYTSSPITHTSYTPHIPTTHSPTPPPLTIPPPETSHPPAPLSAPPHLATPREEKSLGSLCGHREDVVRLHSGDTDFDFDIVQFRVPPPPDQNGSDVIRSSRLPRARTYHEQLMEDEDVGKEVQEEEELKTWRRDGRGLTWRDRCHEETRASPPLDTPPRLPCIPPTVARKRSIGRPTNFQHLRHLDAQAADRLLVEDYVEERAPTREGEKRRGREREREEVKERRTPSLPPSLPHIPPPQDPPPPGKLRKAMIGHPTNFQHVAHVGFGGVEGGH